MKDAGTEPADWSTHASVLGCKVYGLGLMRVPGAILEGKRSDGTKA